MGESREKQKTKNITLAQPFTNSGLGQDTMPLSVRLLICEMGYEDPLS